MKVYVFINLVDDHMRREMELPLSPFKGMQLEVMIDHKSETIEVQDVVYMEKDNQVVLYCDFVDDILVNNDKCLHELMERFNRDGKWVFMPSRAQPV